jgi:hypothetical protein
VSEQDPQSLKRHSRLDPPFHFVTLLVFAINLIVAIVYLVNHPHFYAAWLVVLSVVVFVPIFKLRLYPLKVQDRVIRLEERLRLQALAPAEWHTQIYQLSEDQLIGLRFASDAEVVPLARQALEENLSRHQIKERIKTWRVDNWRV